MIRDYLLFYDCEWKRLLNDQMAKRKLQVLHWISLRINCVEWLKMDWKNNKYKESFTTNLKLIISSFIQFDGNFSYMCNFFLPKRRIKRLPIILVNNLVLKSWSTHRQAYVEHSNSPKVLKKSLLNSFTFSMYSWVGSLPSCLNWYWFIRN